MPSGQSVFAVDVDGVGGVGIAFSEEEIETAVRDRLSAILADAEGRRELEAVLEPLADTAFARDGLDRVLSSIHALPAWRVGEALAEAYLADHRCCLFPWPGGRDLKNLASSPAGTDLVGLRDDGDSTRFAFGEVKTSSQRKSPPDVVVGRHGLVKQLEALCECGSVVDDLVRYLGYHAVGRPWLDRYQDAAKHWLADRASISLFGVLIRDVAIDERDISARVGKLATRRKQPTTVELIAIYLPTGRIPQLPRDVAPAPGGAE
jgi:hypothetical protein